MRKELMRQEELINSVIKSAIKTLQSIVQKEELK